MAMTILSHIAAAVVAIALYLWGSRLLRTSQYRNYRRGFWDRQSAEALKRIGFWEFQQVPEPPAILMEYDRSITAIQTIASMVERGLFEELAKRPGMTEDELTGYLGFSPRKVHAILTLLAAAEVLRQRSHGYELTEKARTYLVRESPLSVPLFPPVPAKQFLRMLNSEILAGARKKWILGKAHEPERIAMQQHVLSFSLGFALYERHVLHGAKRILDVAGGAGSVCVALALKDPSCELQLIELPDSLPVAQKMISRYGLAARIRCVPMNMFTDTWPTDVDAILFTNILHDWDEERCHCLARKAFDALKPGGVVAVQEALLSDDGSGPLWTAHMSMNMALFTRGKQFRESDLRTLLAESGFVHLTRHHLLGAYASMVGVKPA